MMGHLRLGSLPNTQPWKKLVGYLAEGAEVSTIAGAIMAAAARGLKLAKHDPGFADVVELLAKLMRSVREDDWQQKLLEMGIPLPCEPSILDVTLEHFEFQACAGVGDMAG
jgi:hypothetical protein